MGDKKIEALERLLRAEGNSEDEIKAILDINRERNKAERLNSLRSWIAAITAAVALIVSILVAIFK